MVRHSTFSHFMFPSSYIPPPRPHTMQMDYVPQSPWPITGSSKCLTLQHFITISSSVLQWSAWNNQDAQPPADWSIWPPPLILNVLYANTALKWWVTQTTINLIHSWIKDNYYTQQYLEQEMAEVQATYAAKQVEEWAKSDSATRSGHNEVGHEGMLNVLLFFHVYQDHSIFRSQICHTCSQVKRM